jgi:hypothetical protein
MAEVPAKIIKVQDETHVVINKGSDQGIKIGQRYMLYRVTDETLIDPDTEKDLGKLEIALGTGKVTYVKDGWATIESDMPYPPRSRTITKNSFPIASIFGSPQEITEVPSESMRPFQDPDKGDYAKPI